MPELSPDVSSRFRFVLPLITGGWTDILRDLPTASEILGPWASVSLDRVGDSMWWGFMSWGMGRGFVDSS